MWCSKNWCCWWWFCCTILYVVWTSTEQSYRYCCLNPRKQCSPAESFDVFMNSITPVKSTFHSFIDNTTPPSNFNSEAGNPHCCCNASGTDHNIESKLEDHFLKKKTEQSQSKHSPHSVSNPKKRKEVKKSLVRTGPHQIQNRSKLWFFQMVHLYK